MTSGDDRITVACPHCGHRSKARPEQVGVSAKCRECKKTFTVAESHFVDCPKCGDRIPSNAQKCPHCEHSLVPARRATPNTQDCQETTDADRRRGFRKHFDAHGRTSPSAERGAPPYRVLQLYAWIGEAMGCVLIILGPVVVILAVTGVVPELDYAAFGLSIGIWLGVGLVIWGFATMASGQLLYCIRDMAINSYLTARQSTES